MKKLFLVIALSFLFSFLFFSSADAHRSGCHRWHSCPSDTGSYVCGDLGYDTYCPKATPPPKPYTPPVSKQSTSTAPRSFVGVPKTKNQLLQCAVVGNTKSKIYHLKGSKHIKKMIVKGKKCFANESVARKAGFRKSKTR